MSWEEELYRDKDGNTCPISWDQSYAIWRGILIWRRIAAKWNPESYGYLTTGDPRQVDMQKSCLLGRILIEGKEPLPEPPPTAWAAPWYFLIENGSCKINSEFSFSGPHKYPDERTKIIVASCAWDFIGEFDGEYYIRFIKYNPDSDIFRVRKLRQDELEKSFDMIIERVI